MCSRFLTFVMLSMIVSFSIGTALSQSGTDQDITGTVTDSSGATVPSASVTVTDIDRHFDRAVTTNANGNWTATQLPIGNYNVSVEAPGFKKAVTANLKLETGAHLTVNSVLEVGQTTESVEVQAAAVQINAANAELGQTVTGTEATELQLNGRNYIQLLAIAPGVSTTYSSGFSGLYGSYGNVANAQSVNGSLPGSFNTTINGVDDKDPGGNNLTNINPAPDLLAEFRTVAGSFAAEYGQTSGPTIAVSLKSGSTKFHGGGYEFFRNNDLQAYAYQPIGTKVPVKPPLHYNNFGWNFGGPVLLPEKLSKGTKDKLFFFVGQDYKDRRTSTLTTWVVPPDPQRVGDFSALPVSQQPKDPTTGLPYANGMIPITSLDPGMAKLLSLYPQPNTSNGTFNFLSLLPANIDEYAVHVDYLMTPKNSLSFHYIHDVSDFLGNPTNTLTYNRTAAYLNGGLAYTGVINPATVNTLLFFVTGGVIIEQQGIQANGQVDLTNVTKTGLGITTMPSLFGQSNDIPSITITGLQALTTTPLAFNNYTRQWGIKDDFSKIISNHSLKFGVQIERVRKNQDGPGALNGTYGFTAANHPGTTGNATADAALGLFASYTETSFDPVDWARFSEIDAYAQDDWKVSKRLTVNIGLRWAYWQPPYDALGAVTYFEPQYYNSSQAATINPATGFITSNPNPFNGLALQGSSFPSAAKGRISASILNNPQLQALFHGLPLSATNTYWPIFGPRLGFAYDPTGNGTWAVRGGFGITPDKYTTNVGGTSNTPFVTTANILNGQVDNPTGGSVSATPPPIAGAHPLNLKVPNVLNWSLGVQRSLWKNGMVGLTYAGSEASGLYIAENINLLPAGTLQAHPGVNANALRPYQGYGDITEYVNGGNYHYNSLQAQFRKQIAGSGIVTASYTWSKNVSDVNNITGPSIGTDSLMNNSCIRCDYGNAPYNRGNTLSVSYVYPLPFWRSGTEWYQKALGNWQISGVTSLFSGLPINVTIPTDVAGTGVSGTIYERPNLTGQPIFGSGTQYLNPAAFANPLPGTFGNLGANAIFGPMMNNWDAAAEKKFTIKEHYTLDFRAELFDFPNHLSFFGVNSQIGTSTFGQVSTATDPRTLELGLKLLF